MRLPWTRRTAERTHRLDAADAKILGMTRAQIGVVSVVLTLLASWAMFKKAEIATALRAGTPISAEFARQYKLEPHASKVKIAGVPVGVVTGVERGEAGTTVDMKIDGEARDALGTEPSAAIRPSTLLGGGSISVYVELVPGGDPGTFRGTIPVERTQIPVELDRVLEVLTEEPLNGLRTSVRELGETLDAGGAEAMGSLFDRAPATLGPAAEVLQALRGNDGDDLGDVVVGLESLARHLTEEDGRVETLVSGAGSLAGTLDRRREDLRITVSALPSALRQTQGTLAGLDGTLSRLSSVSKPAVPAIEALTDVLRTATPVLAEARPLVAEARPLLADLRPVLEGLAPLISEATQVVEDVRGPVIDRVRNPIIDTVNSPFRGSSTRLYEELAYMLTGLDGIGKITDRNGAAINFNPGFNDETPGGLPFPSPLSGHNDPEAGE